MPSFKEHLTNKISHTKQKRKIIKKRKYMGLSLSLINPTERKRFIYPLENSNILGQTKYTKESTSLCIFQTIPF